MIGTNDMIEMLGSLVETESPSSDVDAVARCAKILASIGADVLGVDAEVLDLDGRPHVRWKGSGPAKVLLLGHFDTVWPLGTIDRWPFSVDGDIATGPGTFDMKAGIVQ